MKRFFLIAGLAAVASASQASGTFTAKWQFGLMGLSDTLKVVFNGGNKTVYAGQFTATRLKDPLGGTSTILPKSTTTPNYDFVAKTFCVELSQTIAANNTQHTHDVVAPLLGATTNNGGHTFDAARVAALQKLWANVSITNNITAAAFQLAQWEITFDGGSGFDLNNGTFKMQSSGNNAAIIAQASTWLGQIGSWTAQKSLVLLRNSSIQDQITSIDGLPPTNVVPEPFTMGLGVAAAGAFVRRRLKARTV